MKPASKAASPHDPEASGLRIVVVVPEEIRAGVYSNFAQIKHGEHDFVIDFAFLTAPDTPEHAARARKEGRIETKANARIVMPPSMAPALVQALQVQIDKWKALMQASTAEAGEEK